jgi:type I restriction enzyme M protein
MRKDKGLNGELDRLPQLTWMLFLKFLDDLEREDEARAALAGRSHAELIPSGYRWRDWAADPAGITGEELVKFVNSDEYLAQDGSRAAGLLATMRELPSEGDADRRAVVRRVFRGVSNRMQNGYLMREVLNVLNDIHFTSRDEVHVLSEIYEGMLREMRDAAGDSGEFYTPRPLVNLIVALIDPKLGETVLDPAAGTGGFLVAAFEHLKPQVSTEKDRSLVQGHTLFGDEPKSLPLMLCEMNLLLHGVEVPNVTERNSLATRLSQIGDSERYDVIVTNPPFGGEEEVGIKANFPADMQTTETALLFLQLIMRRLRRPGHQGRKGGRAAVVVPNGTLFAGGVAARIKEQLVRSFRLHTVLRMPKGVFAPYTDIQTNVLFFDQEGPTESIWFYEHLPPSGRRNYTKTRPLRSEEFGPLLDWWDSRSPSPVAWEVAVSDVLSYGPDGRVVSCDLDQKNPAAMESLELRPSGELAAELRATEEEILQLLEELHPHLA